MIDGQFRIRNIQAYSVTVILTKRNRILGIEKQVMKHLSTKQPRKWRQSLRNYLNSSSIKF
jgi:hypothetical protein